MLRKPSADQRLCRVPPPGAPLFPIPRAPACVWGAACWSCSLGLGYGCCGNSPASFVCIWWPSPRSTHRHRLPAPSTACHLPPPVQFLYSLSPRELSHRAPLPRGVSRTSSQAQCSRGCSSFQPPDCDSDYGWWARGGSRRQAPHVRTEAFLSCHRVPRLVSVSRLSFLSSLSVPCSSVSCWHLGLRTVSPRGQSRGVNSRGGQLTAPRGRAGRNALCK